MRHELAIVMPSAVPLAIPCPACIPAPLAISCSASIAQKTHSKIKMSQKRHFGSSWEMVYFGLLASFPVNYKNCGISKESFPLTHCLKWPDSVCQPAQPGKKRLQQQNSVHRCSIVGHLKSKISHRRQKQLHCCAV